jgi:hypothetical protein
MTDEEQQRYYPIDAPTPRAYQEEDIYYPLLTKIKKEQMWHTADIVKMVMRATLRNGTDTACVESIYRALGLDYTSTRRHARERIDG